MGETVTMTLTEFLLARIAEDEAVARKAVIPAHDGHRPHPELASWTYREGSEVEYASTPEMEAHRYHSPIYVTCDSEGLTASVDETVGPHIARHNPARVLAECAAKRRIVELHTPFHECVGVSEWVERGDCPTLHALASVYADHPDYRAEWRP